MCAVAPSFLDRIPAGSRPWEEGDSLRWRKSLLGCPTGRGGVGRGGLLAGRQKMKEMMMLLSLYPSPQSNKTKGPYEQSVGSLLLLLPQPDVDYTVK